GRAGWTAAALMPVLSDSLECFPRNDWPCAVFSRRAPGRRHGVGPRISARMRLGTWLLLFGPPRGDRSGRAVRPPLLPLLRGSRPLPRGPSSWLERDLLSFHAGRTHRRGKRRNRGAANAFRPANLDTSDRERTPVLPQALWCRRRDDCGASRDVGR